MHRPGWLRFSVLSPFSVPTIAMLSFSFFFFFHRFEICCWATSSSVDAYWCAIVARKRKLRIVGYVAPMIRARSISPATASLRIWLGWSAAGPLFTAAKPPLLYRVASSCQQLETAPPPWRRTPRTTTVQATVLFRPLLLPTKGAVSRVDRDHSALRASRIDTGVYQPFPRNEVIGTSKLIRFHGVLRWKYPRVET